MKTKGNTMKKPVLLIFTLFAAVLPAIAGDLTAEDQATIQAEILKRFTVTTKQIDVPALEKVFDGIFIDARLIREDPGGARSTDDILLAKRGGQIISPENTTRSQPMVKLLSLIKKDFRISDDADAKVFEEALDAIYPISTRRDNDEKVIRQDGKIWMFVRGNFMRTLQGFIVNTDAQGKITGLSYDLKIAKE
jgi:hypothetical protein